jgi:putative hemolysin
MMDQVSDRVSERNEKRRGRDLVVTLAATEDEVLESQRLRFAVFAGEMGAVLESANEGVDRDGFDPYCHHLLVRDQETGAVVASTRLLLDSQAERAGGFYSSSEFDCESVRKAPGRILEIGRTCVHPDYRNGAAVAVLWSGLARFLEIHQVDYMMGCASIPLEGSLRAISRVLDKVQNEYAAPEEFQVTPRLQLPESMLAYEEHEVHPMEVVPPLLKAYLRLGARVCGPPCWDPDFNVLDLFILLDVKQLSPRYARHFLQGENTAAVAADKAGGSVAAAA